LERNAEYYQEQIEFARHMAQRCWQDIPEDQWHETPEGVGTNLTWQVGHLLISQYFAPVVVLFGSQAAVKERISIKEYASLFGLGSDPKNATQFSKSVSEQLQDLAFMQDLTLGLLKEYDYSKLSEPPLREHPVGNTQGKCLDWSIQHEMWHAGQLAMLRKALGYTSTFGPRG